MNQRNPLPQRHTNTSSSRRGGRFLLWGFVLVLVLVFGVGFLSRIPELRIAPGDFSGIVVVDTAEMNTVIEEYFETRFLFPVNSRLWFSHSSLREKLQTNFPRLDNIETNIQDGKLMIEASERQGTFLWCGHELVSVSRDLVCFFADQTGFVFDEAPYFSGSSYLRLYGGLNREISPIGQELGFATISELKDAFTETLLPFGLEIQGLLFLPDRMISFVLVSNNELPSAPVLRYHLDQDMDTALHTIEVALSDGEVLLDIQKGYGTLEYIDVRFKNQFIYKFFDELTPEDVSTSSEIDESLEENLQSDNGTQTEAVEDGTEG